MRLKKIIVVMVICLIAIPAFAQEVTKNTMDSVRDALKAQKRAFIAVNMQLTQAEDAKFWPVYDRYQTDLEKINQKIGDLILDYAKNFETLTDKKADELLKKNLSLEKEMLQLKTSYLPKFSAVLPAKKVARYYQLENKIQAVKRYDLADNIPLVK
ncbi:MAG: hypothetical protein OS130_07795 [Thermodesulfobacteriota bacterium]|jgi:hypothetical protein|nr:MAG: hypothetical protein OS130_07795 [Thermodesulfobacteriota bacterium]